MLKRIWCVLTANGISPKSFTAAWIAGVTAVLTLAVGLLASVCLQIDKGAYRPFLLSESQEIDWHVTSLLSALVAGTVALFWLIYRVQTARAQIAQQTQARVDEQVVELAGYIRRVESLPPEDFLIDYQEAVNFAARVTNSAPDAETLQDLDQAIRNVIACTLILAARFDKRFDRVTYKGNIMVFTPWSEPPAEPLPLVPEVHYGHPDYAGYLELIPELSTTTEKAATYAPDPLAKRLALPVRTRAEMVRCSDTTELFDMLPVAPIAFERQGYAQFHSMLELSSWLDEKCGCSQKQKNAVLDYFMSGEGTSVRSLASLAILDPTLATDRPALGVLNFYIDEEGLLQQQGNARFVPLMEPFLHFLAILLLRRVVFLQKKPAADEPHRVLEQEQ